MYLVKLRFHVLLKELLSRKNKNPVTAAWVIQVRSDISREEPTAILPTINLQVLLTRYRNNVFFDYAWKKYMSIEYSFIDTV